MTYKEFYDKVVYAMLEGDKKSLDLLRKLEGEWFEEVTDDIKWALIKYTMFGITV